MNKKYLKLNKLYKLTYIFTFLFIFLIKSACAKALSNINFSTVGPNTEPETAVIEDLDYLKTIGKEHSEKYYAYYGTKVPDIYDFVYTDVTNLQHKMLINKSALYNDVIWNRKERAKNKYSPLNYNISYGVDVSKHNGNINWKKVKDAGLEFAFIRIVYRGYGKNGTLLQDELAVENLKNAKAAGLKIGAYIFSQSLDDKETLEEAELAIQMLNDNNITLDLPLVYDPETIRSDIARTDYTTGETFTNNAITFCEYVKSKGFTPAIYSNMIWQDYYFDMAKLKDYNIWYADYEDFPQTPYRYTYWQFSERGKVSGITDDGGYVDLNIMIKR